MDIDNLTKFWYLQRYYTTALQPALVIKKLTLIDAYSHQKRPVLVRGNFQLNGFSVKMKIKKNKGIICVI